MNTKEELNAIQEAAEAAAKEDVVLTAEELEQVSGGVYQGACFVYVIEKGDTVSGVAEIFGVDVEILCELNNIHRLCEQLYPGNKLLVPCN